MSNLKRKFRNLLLFLVYEASEANDLPMQRFDLPRYLGTFVECGQKALESRCGIVNVKKDLRPHSRFGSAAVCLRI